MEAKETSVNPFHISLATCGLGAVEGCCLSWLIPVEELGYLWFPVLAPVLTQTDEMVFFTPS